jgi:hypothetical protein
MKWYVRIGNGLLILFFILFISFAYIMDALATGRTYVPSDQVDKKKFTTCRLAGKKVYGDTKFCIYRGANGTYEQLSVPRFELCVREFQCKYSPRGKKETIQDIMEALERSMR